MKQPENAAQMVRLAILDTYGVRWSIEALARDLLQNFFDAAPDFRAVELCIQPQTRTVEIRGPVTFDADLLAYVGATTKKTTATVGGFGEGFKICALVGTRDFGLTITAGTGKTELQVVLDPVPLGRELCYRVTHRKKPFAGSFVRLQGCNDACLAAFQAAPSMFRHPGNPNLGSVLVEDASQGVAVYKSPDPRRGELYYRRQLRGYASFWAFEGAKAITLAHDGGIDGLEGDRDRRNLPTKPIAYEIGKKLSKEMLQQVLWYLSPYWTYGCEVLSGFVQAAIDRKLKFEFPLGWLARGYKDRGEIDIAHRKGYKVAMASFGRLGMMTTEEKFPATHPSRPANPLQRAQIQVLADLYEDLSGSASSIQDYHVFDIEGAAVRGQYRPGQVFVAAELLETGFDDVAGTLLHEFSHERGPDNDPLFWRQLMRLTEATLRDPERIRAARRQYKVAKPAPEADPSPKQGDPSKKGPVKRNRRHGVVCTLVAPPGFPPAEALIEELYEIADENGIPIDVRVEAVTGPIGAVCWQAPGVPTLWIGNIDPEPPAEPAALGYYLRRYGHDGDAQVTPCDAAIEVALHEAYKAGMTGDQSGHKVRCAIHDAGKLKATELLGVRFPDPPAEVTSEYASRDEKVRDALMEYCSFGDFHDLRQCWSEALDAAGERLLQDYSSDPRAADVVWQEIRTKLDTAVAYSWTLRRADADFDDADKFERDAMQVAQGVAALAYVQTHDESQAKALAQQHFDAIRAIVVKTFDLDVSLAIKPVILEQTLQRAGLHISHPAGMDLKALAAAFETVAAAAIEYQSDCDASAKRVHPLHLIAELSVAGTTKGQTRKAYLAEQQRTRDAIQAMRLLYDEQLATGQDPLVAAARWVEEASKRLPEERL